MRKINSYRIIRSIRNQELQIIKLKRRTKKEHEEQGEKILQFDEKRLQDRNKMK